MARFDGALTGTGPLGTIRFLHSGCRRSTAMAGHNPVAVRS